MAKSPTTASLRDLVVFDSRVPVADGYGNETSGEFTEQFAMAAEFRHRGGSEAVVAARLEGRNVFGVYIRSSVQSRTITTDWRMRDARRGTVYAIDAVDAITDQAWIYLTVESGVAA